MSSFDVSKHFLESPWTDSQWTEHIEETSQLVWRKLSPYLSKQDQEALQSKLSAVCEAHEERAAHTILMMPDAFEDHMRIIYERFGVHSLRQLLRWGVFTSEEGIRAYIES